jgi:hypothetical protein
MRLWGYAFSTAASAVVTCTATGAHDWPLPNCLVFGNSNSRPDGPLKAWLPESSRMQWDGPLIVRPRVPDSSVRDATGDGKAPLFVCQLPTQ